MKKMTNTDALDCYKDLFDEQYCLKGAHPAFVRMQELSAAANYAEPTALTRLEVYKECHRLADELYEMTGSKRVSTHVMRIGNLLLSRLFKGKDEMQVNE